MWAHPKMMLDIHWIILWSLVQTQGFSTTVVKEGEDAIIECGLQTKVAEGYLRWQAITNDIPEELAYDLRDGILRCDERIINCTLYANGSIQLESVSKEDAARYYRCLRGDAHGYNYYSDHRLSVLSKESPSISQSPTSAIAFKASRKGIVHSYEEPVCEDNVDGNLPVVCYPPSGVIVDREYETIQCNCTDSDGLMDSVTFHVTRQKSSSPSIETPHRESVSSYNIDKKGVLHGYNAPLCEDDVDGNLPVVCYPPSGMIVDREYETIQCNCTDSDGLMDSVTIPVTSLTHWVHPGWRKASISLLVILISIIVVVIWIGLNLCKILKKSNTNREHAAEDMEEMTPVQSGTKDKQISDLKHKIAALEGTLNTIQTKLTVSEKEVSHLKLELKQKEKQETMKNKLEEQHKKISKRSTQRESQVMRLEGLQGILEMLETEMNKLEEQNEKINTIQTELTEREREVSNLKEQLEQKDTQETEMKNKLEEQNEKSVKIAKEMTVTGLENRDLNKLLEEKQDQPQKMLESSHL